MTLHDLLATARLVVAEIEPDEAHDRLPAGAVLVDVREPDETIHGVIPGSVLIPRGLLETTVESVVADRDTELIVSCASGVRSLLAGATLHQFGYRRVSSLAGGFTAWKAAGLPWTAPAGLDSHNRARYSRHLLLPEVGEVGQQQLLDSRVLIVGAGGLGSPAALYLAAAGVGTIGLADMDAVDLSNLQRQIIHTTHRVGEAKVSSAARSITDLNPGVRVQQHHERVGPSNAEALVAGYDLVIDGADNFEVRYALSDASESTNVPVVYGSVFRFEGQVTVFDPRAGFTYRSFLPEAPPPEVAPNCATAGVLGVLPGIIGTIQAAEAIKMLLGIGEPLIGRILVVDALAMETTELKLRGVTERGR